MPTVVEFDGRSYEVPAGHAELDQLLQSLTEQEIVKVDKFESKENAEVVYDPMRFLSDADKYYELEPPNLLQCASKLWLGTVHSIKAYFLKMSIHVTSHEATRHLFEFVVRQMAVSGEQLQRLTNGWNSAEDFHRYTYYTLSHVDRFEDRKGQVEELIQFFHSCEPTNDLKKAIERFQHNRIELRHLTEPGRARIGKKTYDYHTETRYKRPDKKESAEPKKSAGSKKSTGMK